jgi:hypothetical protein
VDGLLRASRIRMTSTATATKSLVFDGRRVPFYLMCDYVFTRQVFLNANETQYINPYILHKFACSTYTRTT